MFQYGPFSSRIVEFREKTIGSQQEAGDQNDVARRAWGFYESGKRDMPLFLLEKLCRKGLNLNWLFTGEETMRRAQIPPVTPGFPKPQIIRGTAVALKAKGVLPMDEGDFGILVANAAELLLLGMTEAEVLDKIGPAAQAFRDRAVALGLFPDHGGNSDGPSR